MRRTMYPAQRRAWRQLVRALREAFRPLLDWLERRLRSRFMLERYFQAYFNAAGRGRHWMHVEDGHVDLCTERDGCSHSMKQSLVALHAARDPDEYARMAAARMNQRM